MVAGGAGLRAGLGSPKQFHPIAGIPMLLWSVRPFLAHPAVGRVVLVVPPQVVATPPDWLAPLVGERLRLARGGAERIDSVEQGVTALDGEFAIVVIHDGARPFVDPTVIDEVIAAARAGTGAIAAVPVSDTLKRDDRSARPRIAATVAREGLWRAQTPQAFPIAMLQGGLAEARALGALCTDDAAMVELTGQPVRLIPDRSTNIKVTTPDDFVVAEAIGRARR